ncbi:hypothetical protein BJX99DRAFT_264337 [Aspergillus californicus]
MDLRQIIRAGIIAQIAVSKMLDDAAGAVETFIVGAALSATSLGDLTVLDFLLVLMQTGTTFAVISSASRTVNLAHTRIGAVLVSAAVIDDLVGLVMARFI